MVQYFRCCVSLLLLTKGLKEFNVYISTNYLITSWLLSHWMQTGNRAAFFGQFDLTCQICTGDLSLSGGISCLSGSIRRRFWRRIGLQWRCRMLFAGWTFGFLSRLGCFGQGHQFANCLRAVSTFKDKEHLLKNISECIFRREVW